MKTFLSTLIFLGLFLGNLTLGQNKNILQELIDQNADKLSSAINDLNKYEIQILYTKIEKDKIGKTNLSTFSFNEKPNKYFYPASTVKLPAAILALEKLNDINVTGLNKYTHLSIDSVYDGHVSISKEFRTECGKPNIADYIKQIFLVSDNESFNRLYDFLGQKEINERLIKRGFNNTKIVHRLSVARTSKQNMETNPIKFYDENGNTIYEQQARYDSANVELNLTQTKKGVGYLSNGELVNQPKEFSENNFFGLRDQHNLLIRIFYHKLFSEEERFNLTEEDYNFLQKVYVDAT